MAVRFSADGAKVVLLDKGRDACSYFVDITDRSAVYDIASRVKNEVGLV